jgi:Fe2+ or Zn2+ uptake regulation protein
MSDLKERFASDMAAKGVVSTKQAEAVVKLLDAESISADDILKALRDSLSTTSAAADE